HRPLWLGTVARGDKIFWASEWEMIDYATTTSSTNYKFYFDKDKHCFFPLPVNEWHSYDLEELAKAVDGPIQPKIVEVKGRAPVAKADPFGRDVDGWDANRMGFRVSTSTTNSSTTQSRGSKSYVDCLNIEGDAQSPFAGFVSKADFDLFSRGGCAWCKAPVKFTDIGLDRKSVV